LAKDANGLGAKEKRDVGKIEKNLLRAEGAADSKAMGTGRRNMSP
jgi:hypothetical protein